MHSNRNNIHKSNGQHWLTTDRTPEPYSYNSTSRPPGSVLPIPQQQPQQQPQPHHHHNLPLQHPVAYHPSMHHKDHFPSLSPPPPLPAQALDPEHAAAQLKGNSRSIIPSKRAAQNRAAQKAFRQRREQYIKDLELKAKEMEDWQDEMDKMRKENKELREKVLALEEQITALTGGHIKLSKPSIEQRSDNGHSQPQEKDNDEAEKQDEDRDSSPDTKSTNQTPPEQPKLTSDNKNNANERSFIPVPLQAPNQTGFESPQSRLHKPDSASITDNKRRKVHEDHPSLVNQTSMPASVMPVSGISSMTPSHQQHELTGIHPTFWNSNTTGGDMSNLTAIPAMGDFDLDFDFDPFFEEEFGPTIANNNDFLPTANSGQVLDDLFAMLQTRQRPQIPMIPAEDTSEHAHLSETIETHSTYHTLDT
ncbi:hypothetical protein BD560DRAFT_486099 [Blakeslea trispora]|nr:hypothetical protein BD560DRAFT_486099 [Blakeslea trispora]